MKKKGIFLMSVKFLIPLSVILILILVISNIINSFIGVIGGWKIKQSSNSTTVAIMDGLPPWITAEFILSCLDLQDKYGIYASVTIAQAQQEVGGTWNGTSLYDTAAIEHNFFGLKGSSGSSMWNNEITWDGTLGATGTYRKYVSIAQGLTDRARLLMTGSPYTVIATTATNRSGSNSQLVALSNSAWCENQYNTLQKFMDMYNLTRLDSMTKQSYIAQYAQTGGGGGTFNGTFVYYNQADPQWGSLPYVRGDSIASSGCAATSLAMIWATYSKNMSITPTTIFGTGNGNGALVTGWLSRPGCVAATNSNSSFGCTAEWLNYSTNWDKAKAAMDKGGAVMCVGAGAKPYTSGGHWIVMIGYSGNTVYLADPGHRACTWSQIGGGSEGMSFSSVQSMTQDMIIFTPR